MASVEDRYVPILERSSLNDGRYVSRVTHTTESHSYSTGDGFVLDGAKSFAATTESEKKQLQDLNERLGNYIARVRLLEKQNRGIVSELENLKKNWGTKYHEHRIEFASYQTKYRGDINSATLGKCRAEIYATRYRDQIAEYRARIDEYGRLREIDINTSNQNRTAIKEAEAELHQLLDKLRIVQGEEKAALAENAYIRNELLETRERRDELAIYRIDYQSQAVRIENEIEFLKKLHATEISELNRMVVTAPTDTKEFFKNEIAQAILDIRKEFDRVQQISVVKIEQLYTRKLSEQPVRKVNHYYTESARTISTKIEGIQSKFTDIEKYNQKLVAEYESLTKQREDDQHTFERAIQAQEEQLISIKSEYGRLFTELQSLLETKVFLDTEIAIYRAMVEGEERRVGVSRVASRVTNVIKHIDEHDMSGDATTTTKFQTHALGNITISKCDPIGRFIVFENTSKSQNEYLDGWKIVRHIDNITTIEYIFPTGTLIKANRKLIIYAQGQGKASNEALVNVDKYSWGMGTQVITYLYNAHGEEKAKYIQSATADAI